MLYNNYLPLVSIIIPVYNGSNFLSEAIDSALNQTYKKCEIIVINDGSTDNGKTENIALSYGEKIKYYKKENGWVSSALNFGIKLMKGDYFSWLSHDDLYYPQKIEEQIKYLMGLEDKSTILYTDFNYIDENSLFLSDCKVKHVLPEHFRPAFIWGGLINGCTLLIPKKCFEICGTFDESLRTTQDYDLWFRFSEKYSFVHMQQILVQTRLHSNQVAIQRRQIMKIEENSLFRNFISKITNNEIKQYYEKPAPIFYLDYSRVMLNSQLSKVANFSFFLGLVNFWRLEPRCVYEYLNKVGLVLVTILKHKYRSFHKSNEA
jgi:glycosyltransferase involved in cell wall biosynthesis